MGRIRIDTYNCLSRIYRLISFAFSPFRIPIIEPFPIPYDYSKETLPKHLYDTLRSSTVFFSHALTPEIDIEPRDIHYSSARSDQLGLHGTLEEISLRQPQLEANGKANTLEIGRNTYNTETLEFVTKLVTIS
jgi:hypothetical protein